MKCNPALGLALLGSASALPSLRLRYWRIVENRALGIVMIVVGDFSPYVGQTL